jgi:hypothetical protein
MVKIIHVTRDDPFKYRNFKKDKAFLARLEDHNLELGKKIGAQLVFDELKKNPAIYDTYIKSIAKKMGCEP